MKKLPKEVITFIKNVKGLSYSEIIREVKRRWGIAPSKSTLSYYRRSGVSRIRSINLSCLRDWEWDWLVGLYYADGTRYKDVNYHYTIKFSLQLNEEEIVKRIVNLLNRLGNIKAWTRREGGCIRVLACSRQLYELLPSKDEPYEPKDELAFLAGLIDGDGSITKRTRKDGYFDIKMIFSQTSFVHLAEWVLKTGRKYGDVSLYVMSSAYNPYSNKPEHRVNFSTKAINNLRNSVFQKYCIKMRTNLI